MELLNNLKATLARIHHGLDKKEKFILLVMIMGIVGINAYAISDSFIRFQRGTTSPDSNFQAPPIDNLPPFTVIFCTPEKLGILTPEYDGLGPALARAYHHGQVYIGADFHPDILGVDYGTKIVLQGLNCTYWHVDDFQLNDPLGSTLALVGNSRVTNTVGFLSLVQKSDRPITQADLYGRDYVPLNGYADIRLQLHTLIRLNGNITHTFEIDVRGSSTFTTFPQTLNTSYGYAYYSFMCFLHDYFVVPESQTIVETRSFTLTDIFTTTLTFLNLSLTVMVCCFPRQYLVASVQTFCLNPKPIYDPYKGTMIEMNTFRLPHGKNGNGNENSSKGRKEENSLVDRSQSYRRGLSGGLGGGLGGGGGDELTDITSVTASTPETSSQARTLSMQNTNTTPNENSSGHAGVTTSLPIGGEEEEGLGKGDLGNSEAQTLRKS